MKYEDKSRYYILFIVFFIVGLVVCDIWYVEICCYIFGEF